MILEQHCDSVDATTREDLQPWIDKGWEAVQVDTNLWMAVCPGYGEST